MKLEKCNHANSTNRGLDNHERFLENRIDGKITFEERLKLAEEKVELIINAPTYRKLAEDLLDRMNIVEIKNLREEDLEKESGDYDAAVLLALCIRLSKDRDKSEEDKN